jgi:hypothetical protein
VLETCTSWSRFLNAVDLAYGVEFDSNLIGIALGATDESANYDGRKRKVTDETTETLRTLLLIKVLLLRYRLQMPLLYDSHTP